MVFSSPAPFSDDSRSPDSLSLWERVRVRASRALSEGGAPSIADLHTIALSNEDALSTDSTAEKIALVLEYDGAEYQGFQVQSEKSTVQGVLEQALRSFYGRHVKTWGASRTDAGVHAEEQVVAYLAPREHAPTVIRDALNFYLPQDVKVREAWPVHVGFDPRRHARSRVYAYTICNAAYPSPMLVRTSHHVKARLDTQAMDRAARSLEGVHDFAAFTTDEYASSHPCVRIIRQARVDRSGDLVTLTLEANAFLPHQVRRTVGALVEVGLGRMTPAGFAALVEAPGKLKALPALPAKGLTLKNVRYPDFPPAAHREDERSGRDALAQLLAHRAPLTAARS
ncbi:MAG: tRNA pseudouridine(38-40) synthase TruA [Dehalococcoidia bacterium]|nr:tRNA pseudouridine(38-40) synthase TruA [Dehalococcoidia bacterium]